MFWKSRKAEANDALLEIAAQPSRLPLDMPWKTFWNRSWDDTWYSPNRYDANRDNRERRQMRQYYNESPFFAEEAAYFIRGLVKHSGADVNARDAFGNTPLMLAIVNDNTTIARTLLNDLGADINAQNKYGETALTQAAVKGDAAFVRDLLLKGADTASKNALQQTAADIAATTKALEPLLPYLKGEKPVADLKSAEDQMKRDAAVLDAATGPMKYLQDALDKGGSPNAASRDGATALFFAYSLEHAQLLIDRGADVNARDTKGRTALMVAADKGQQERIDALLKAGADPALTDADGKTAVDYAEERNNYKAADKIESEIISRSGNKPELLAAFEKKKAQRQLLDALRNDDPMAVVTALKAGADVNGLLPGGTTPLIYSITHASAGTTAVLVQANADLNQPDAKGVTPLAQAYMAGQTKRFAKLLELGASPNVTTAKGLPLLIDMLINSRGGLDALLAAKPDVNVTDANGVTPIQLLTVNGGGAQLVKPLADLGANMNTPDAQGYTPLMIALINRRTETAQALLEAGADASIAGPQGETALSIAQQQNSRLYQTIHAKLLDAKDTRIAHLEAQVRSLSGEMTAKPPANDTASTTVVAPASPAAGGGIKPG
jgi:ankyrin repeat protein